MKKTTSRRLPRPRLIAVLALGIALGVAIAAAPASGHITSSVSHVADHMKNYFYTKSQSEARYLNVSAAGNLERLKSGQSQSGAFSAAAGNSTGSGGWLGVGISYTRPLAAPIADANIVDVRTGSAPNCPGAGQAAPGYLCLYNSVTNNASSAYMYSASAPDGRFGVVVYFPVSGDHPYAGGTWTVTAP